MVVGMVLARGKNGDTKGGNVEDDGFFSYVNMSDWIPDDHPLSPIKVMCEAVLGRSRWLLMGCVLG